MSDKNRTKKNIYNFELDRHPKFGNRKPDLAPNQSGLLTIRKEYKEKKKSGDYFEEKIYQTIKRSFPNDVVLHNLYFETGNYIEPLKIYESLQIDFIMICSEGVFCVEAKAISDDNYSLLGDATAKKWTIKTSHGTNTETNGVKQNHKHAAFLEKVLEFEKIKCPVYKITVIGIIQRSKIKVQEYIDDNLVSEGELIDRIEYIKNRNKSVKIDVDEIKNILEDWKCEIEGIDKLHMVYVRNIKNKKLPKRCKKVLRQL